VIDSARDGPRLTLTINRPDKANALTREMLETLAREVEGAAGHHKVLVLTGRGRVFSAGADLAAARAGLATDPVWERLSGAVARFPGLSIAALNGSAAGGALGMVLACDLRVGVAGGSIFYPVMKLGFLPQPSDPRRLTALVGPARAKLILMGGVKLTMAEAGAIGLVDRVVAAEELGPTVDAWGADTLAAQSEHAAAIKAMVDG